MRRDRLPHRTQAGTTLLEVLVAMTVSVLVVGPVVAWMLATLDQSAGTIGRFNLASATRTLNTYFDRDVASAEVVTDKASDCSAEGLSSKGRTVLGLTSLGSRAVRVVYVEAPSSASSSTSPGEASLWRRQCDLTTRRLLAEDEIIVGVSNTTSSCVPADPVGGLSNCRELSLTTDPVGGDEVTVSATRRADPADADGSGGFRPEAQVKELSRSGTQPLTVVLSPADSYDIDGQIVDYRWEFPGQPPVTSASPDSQTHVFLTQGSYTVVLTVTDDAGNTNSTTVNVNVYNQSPTAVASVSSPLSAVGTAGITTFTFSAAGSIDPDGSIKEYRWEFEDGEVALGPNVSHVFSPSAPAGPREVALVVTDNQEATSRAVVQITLDRGAQSLILISPEPVNVVGKVARVGSVGPGQPPLTVTLSSATQGVRWEVRADANPSTIFWRSDSDAAVRDFGPGEGGVYTVTMLSKAGGPPLASRQFRVNTTPVASFDYTNVTGDAPVTIRFTDTSTDADGSTVGPASWDFGFFGQWTASADKVEQTFTQPGDYLVTLRVTDDDGAVGQLQKAFNIPGKPSAPVRPIWQSNQVVIAAVPGAASYRVTVSYGQGRCTDASLSVPPSALPVVEAPPCPTASEVSAVVAVQANGLWSVNSAVAVKP